MTKEYIEREAAKARLRMWITDCLLDGDNETADRFRDCIDLLDSIPAADVTPVVYGRWIEKTAHDRPRYFECSNCGKQENKHTAIRGGFCWNCGAKMDKEETK